MNRKWLLMVVCAVTLVLVGFVALFAENQEEEAIILSATNVAYQEEKPGDAYMPAMATTRTMDQEKLDTADTATARSKIPIHAVAALETQSVSPCGTEQDAATSSTIPKHTGYTRIESEKRRPAATHTVLKTPTQTAIDSRSPAQNAAKTAETLDHGKIPNAQTATGMQGMHDDHTATTAGHRHL